MKTDADEKEVLLRQGHVFARLLDPAASLPAVSDADGVSRGGGPQWDPARLTHSAATPTIPAGNSFWSANQLRGDRCRNTSVCTGFFRRSAREGWVRSIAVTTRRSAATSR